MKCDVMVRMLVKKRRHGFCLVDRQVVEDRVDLPFGLAGGYLSEKANEVLARMPSRRLAVDLGDVGVQGSVERQRAVTPVLESVLLDGAGRQRVAHGRDDRAPEWQSSHGGSTRRHGEAIHKMLPSPGI